LAPFLWPAVYVVGNSEAVGGEFSSVSGDSWRRLISTVTVSCVRHSDAKRHLVPQLTRLWNISFNTVRLVNYRTDLAVDNNV